MQRAFALLLLPLAACDHDALVGVPLDKPAADNVSDTPDCTGLGSEPTDATWTLRHGNVDRVFDVHVPAGYRPERAVPLVLNFHGYGSNKDQQAFLSRMKDKADEAGFIAVHPQGTGFFLGWNAGGCCGAADDVGFTGAMLDALAARLCVDRRRVYATGFSNGGMFTHRLACELSDRIAAFAPVSGIIVQSPCTPPRPVPLLHTHGSGDPTVPYNGSFLWPSAPQTVDDWAARDSCASPATETFRDGNAHCEMRGGCAANVEVGLCTIDGGVHMWPGGMGELYADLDGTGTIWNFLSRWTLP